MHPRVQWTLGYLRRVLLDLCELVPIGTWTVSDSHFNKFRFSVCLSLSLSLSPSLSRRLSRSPIPPPTTAFIGASRIDPHRWGLIVTWFRSRYIDLGPWKAEEWRFLMVELCGYMLWLRRECVKESYANRVELWWWERWNELHLGYWCSPWHSIEICAHEFPMIGVACIMHSFGSFACFYSLCWVFAKSYG